MEEKKNYSVIGKVEIGTDEYRDLIEERAAAIKEAEEYRSKYWKEQTELRECKEALDKSKNMLNKLYEFLKEKNLMDKYKLWKIDRQKGDDE